MKPELLLDVLALRFIYLELDAHGNICCHYGDDRITEEDLAAINNNRDGLKKALKPKLVFSNLHGETVRIIEWTETFPIPEPGQPVTYSREELKLLDGLSDEDKKAAHLQKRAFGGKYLGPPADEFSFQREAEYLHDQGDPLADKLGEVTDR